MSVSAYISVDKDMPLKINTLSKVTPDAPLNIHIMFGYDGNVVIDSERFKEFAGMVRTMEALLSPPEVKGELRIVSGPPESKPEADPDSDEPEPEGPFEYAVVMRPDRDCRLITIKDKHGNLVEEIEVTDMEWHSAEGKIGLILKWKGLVD